MRAVLVCCLALVAACANADPVDHDAGEVVDAAEVDATDGAVDATDGAVDATDATDACVPGTEVCNAADDDCDGRMDEGLMVGEMCDGADTDSCREGLWMCGAGGATVCTDVSGSTPEICNGLDDDCVGGVDDGYAVGMACSTGVGGCARPGVYACNGEGTGVLCSATQGTPTAETCGDGVDQDCNGADVGCPVNDLPTGAVDVSAGGTFTVDLVAAHDDDANAGTSCGSTGGRDVFYQLTLPAAEVVYLDTFGSSFDSAIRVYSGTCAARAGAPVCDDDAGVCAGLQSQLATPLGAGTWCVVVDQFSSLQTTGALILTVVRGGRTGTAIATASGSQTGTTCGAANASTSGCQTFSTAPEQAYFFTVCPSETRTVGASTCTTATSWDSIVYLRKAPVATDVACNDDGPAGCGTVSPIRLSSFAGASAAGPGLFWLLVDGFNTACGAYTLTYTM